MALWLKISEEVQKTERKRVLPRKVDDAPSSAGPASNLSLLLSGLDTPRYLPLEEMQGCMTETFATSKDTSSSFTGVSLSEILHEDQAMTGERRRHLLQAIGQKTMKLLNQEFYRGAEIGYESV